MKKVFFAFVLAAFTLSCQQKQTQRQATDANTQEPIADVGDEQAGAAPFNISDYLDVMSDNPELRYGIGDLELSEYALYDIDGDGQDEVWVRAPGQNYLAIYVLNDSKLELVAYADGCTDLTYYKNAVAYDAYYSPGRACKGAQVVKNSKLADSYWEETNWDIFDDEAEEVTDESYYINGKESTKADCEHFTEQLGTPIDAPEPDWMPIR